MRWVKPGVSRKGSMQLSIEAIIVLVIAMVLLGLGIAFIQGFFKTGTDKLTEPFNAIEFGCDPNAGKPITTSPASLEVKSGDQLQVKMCVYANIPASDAIMGIEGCTSTVPEGAGMVPQLLAQQQTIARTEIGGFNTILLATNKTGDVDLPVGTYICTLSAVTGGVFPVPANGTGQVIGTRQITISVT